MISVRQLVFASACVAVPMTIEKITVINNCADDVYFAQSVPSNAKIAAGDHWSGDWKVGNGNIAGRLNFSYFADAFAHGAGGNNTPLNFVWMEIARGTFMPNVKKDLGGWNFANQPGFIDMDLEVVAFDGDKLACDDGKARVALDVSKCSEFGDSASLETYNGKQWCKNSAYDPTQCATSDIGRSACTSAYAVYLSDHSMLWKPNGSSATDGNWLAQPRSTGNLKDSDKEHCPAQYADGFVAAASLNGRVACNGGNGAAAVNFECWESCCKPDALKPHQPISTPERVAQCDKVNGVTSGNAGFMQCHGKSEVTVTNLQITTCASRASLSSSNVKMPSCPSRRLRSFTPKRSLDDQQCGPAEVSGPQNPQTWSPEAPKIVTTSSNSANGTSSTTASATSSADATTKSNASSETNSSTSTTTTSPSESDSESPSSASSTTISPTSSGSDSSSSTSSSTASPSESESESQSTSSRTTVSPTESTTTFQV